MPGQSPGGVLEVFGPHGRTEHETFTCCHCQKVTVVTSRKQIHAVGDVCRSCMRLICADCAGKPCRPWEKEMERQEARYRMLRDMGLAT